VCHESESLEDKETGRGLRMMYELLIAMGRKRMRKDERKTT
jgi:hypothetical protein